MQAPPPPLHGPKNKFSFDANKIISSLALFSRQHLKSFPPGHKPLIVSPFHLSEKTQIPCLPSLAQGISSQHLILLFKLFEHFPEKLFPPILLHLLSSMQIPFLSLHGR